MGDLLDENVPAEFYLSEEKTQSVIRHDSNHPGHIADRGDVSNLTVKGL